MNRHLLLVIALLASSLPAAAQPKPKRPLNADAVGVNYRLSFLMKDGALSRSGAILVAEGSQTNYVSGGEKPNEVELKQGTGVEFKKHAAIVNCVLASSGEEVRAECQFELSGAQPALADLKTHPMPITTFQYQSAFRVTLGKPLVLVDEADRRIEVTVSKLD